ELAFFAIVDKANLGEERAFAQFIDDDVEHLGPDGFQRVAEQVVGHGARRLDLLQLQRDGLRLEGSDDDRQAAVSVDLAQHQGIRASARRTGRKADNVYLYHTHMNILQRGRVCQARAYYSESTCFNATKKALFSSGVPALTRKKPRSSGYPLMSRTN